MCGGSGTDGGGGATILGTVAAEQSRLAKVGLARPYTRSFLYKIPYYGPPNSEIFI
jgi:hypothetical protein